MERYMLHSIRFAENLEKEVLLFGIPREVLPKILFSFFSRRSQIKVANKTRRKLQPQELLDQIALSKKIGGFFWIQLSAQAIIFHLLFPVTVYVGYLLQFDAICTLSEEVFLQIHMNHISSPKTGYKNRPCHSCFDIGHFLIQNSVIK